MKGKSERIIYLINRFLSDEITDPESKELKQLIDAGEVSGDELIEFQNIWNTTGNIDLDFSDSETVYEKIMLKGKDSELLNRKIIYNLLKIAAIIIFGAIIGIGINRYFLTEKDKFVEIVTRKGDKIHISLPDNNDVWINSNSSIRYPANFTGSSRFIEIKGEAFFSLQSNVYHPVIIKCSGTDIVGTSSEFNIKTDSVSHNTEITVQSGWITLSDPMWNNQQVVLEAGFKGTIDQQLPLFIEQNRNPNYLAWKTGRLVFNKTPLLAVAETLSDVYDVNVKINGEVKYCYVTSTYVNKKIDIILDDIKEKFQTKISRENNMIIIDGNSCNTN